MRIGWKPRITFERALKQTREYAIDYYLRQDELEILETEVKQAGKGKSVVDRVKDVFFEKVEDIKDEDQTKAYGALGRLIAERKSQEKSRKGSVVLANEHLANRIKKEKTPQSGSERVLTRITRTFDNFTKRFSGLKNLTIREFLLYSVLLVTFGYIYINGISVFLSLGRNIYSAQDSFNSMVGVLDDSNQNDITYFSSNAQDELSAGRDKVERLDYLSIIPGFTNLVASYNDIFFKTTPILSSIEILSESSTGVTQYTNSFNPEIVYRPDSSSLLSVQNRTKFASEIDLMKSEERLLDIEVDRLDTALSSFLNLRLDSLGIENEDLLNKKASWDESLRTFVSRYSASGRSSALCSRNRLN